MVVILRHLALEDYGPFTKLDIDLGDITIFVGRNNTGKSTALEAVTLLLSLTNDFKISMYRLYTDVLFSLGRKANYLVNLRSNSGVVIISGDVVSQGVEPWRLWRRQC